MFLMKKMAFTILALSGLVSAVSAQMRKPHDFPPDAKFIPASADAKPFTGDFGKLPDGCPEFEVDLPRPEKEIVVNAADFGLNGETEDAAVCINKALAHCKKIGASKLVLPKGVYKVFSETTIEMTGYKDFTFDGNGSTLVYRKKSWLSPNFRVEDCERTVFENIDFDYDWKTEPLAAIVKVVGVSTEKGNIYADLNFVHYKKYPLYNKDMVITVMSVYDEKKKHLGVVGRSPVYIKLSSMDHVSKYEWLSPNTVRCHFKTAEMMGRIKEGYYFRAQHSYYDCNVFNLVSNKHQTFRNINIWSAKGFGFRVDGSQQYWQLLNFNMTPPKGQKKRVISTTADNLHIARSLGNFKMVNCIFTHAADDCVNIHDSTEYVSRASDFSIKIGRIKNERFYNGDSKIELRNFDFSPTGYFAKIRDKKVKGNTIELFFDKKLPDDKGKGFVMFDRQYWSRNFLVQNCKFGFNRARGMLILTDNVTIENTVFEKNEMGAMKIETGHCPSWAEGYGVDNMVVRNCTFKTPNTTGGSNHGLARDIGMNMYLFKDNSAAVNAYPMLKNILFEKNKFIDTIGMVAFIGCAENIIFRDNDIVAKSKLGFDFPTRGGFFVIYSKNVKIVNNRYNKSNLFRSAGVSFDPKSTSNVVAEGNVIADF